MSSLNASITVLPGIGEATASKLSRLGIATVRDLLYYLPSGYETYNAPASVAAMCESTMLAISAIATDKPNVANNRVTCTVRDDSGQTTICWFGQPYIANTISIGKRYVFRGPVHAFHGKLSMTNPQILSPSDYEINIGRLMAVYPLTAGITKEKLRKTVSSAFAWVQKHLIDIPDYLPAHYLAQHQMPDSASALRALHCPEDMAAAQAAHSRLAFDEFFAFGYGIRSLVQARTKQASRYLIDEGACACEADFTSRLDFELTESQKKVLSEIKDDLRGMSAMNRLLQGDVGCGKTIVAVIAIFMVAKHGYQSAYLAPTLVLAEQQYTQIARMFAPFGIRVASLTGQTKRTDAQQTLTDLENGEIDVVVGTHALLTERVTFKSLALCVIDEGHRFGVAQRMSLAAKGDTPHVLVMSATPIPRTLALILYADMDISVIDTLPEGRKHIKTGIITKSRRRAAYKLIGQEIAQGRQVYVICPLIAPPEDTEKTEDVTPRSMLTRRPVTPNSEKMPTPWPYALADGMADLENVADTTARLRGVFPTAHIDSLHGKMKPDEKTAVMRRFESHETDILVSTTVIEVGVNVPNATVMMIEDAHRFGLAALHQLRGRIGRGEHQSYCILVDGGDGTSQRLQILTECHDGFEIAQKDLAQRGPGEMTGYVQSGEQGFRAADIYTDYGVLTQANTYLKTLSDEQLQDIVRRRPEIAQGVRVGAVL